MKVDIESSGSNSRSGEDLIPLPTGRGSTTNDMDVTADAQPQIPLGENEKTVISQRPIAAPEEFFRSMPLSELATLLEGKQLDHFQVEQMVGGGGMGAVFRGRDLRLDRVVAIKVIPASKRDAETLRRFRLEAQSAARLDHPNIARVYYVGEAEQWNYIVFEFIDGINIRDLVDMDGPLSVDDAVFYARQVAEALEHAHERNVVHRDIKPSNVLVTPLGIAKVVDMGLARDTSLDKSTADATASGVTLGTFDYISPEQARNPRDADVRSDLYSLGCTLFFMLTGNPPFPEGTALQKLLNHGSQPPPDPRAWREDVSDQLFEIIMKLMAKRPNDRYQRPLDLINDLLLLAEAEDLPRSRTPGTVMLTPSISQRSLLESNLPWMVALAFLLGSTLWLQSVQSISGTFTIPPPTFPSIRQTDTVAPSSPQQPNGVSRSNAESEEELNQASPIPANLSPPAPPSAGNPAIVGTGETQASSAVADPLQFPLSPELQRNAPDSKLAILNARDIKQLDRGLTMTEATVITEVGPVREPTVESGVSPVDAAYPEAAPVARTVTTLVVSENPPAGVERQAWASSLTSALRRAEIETDIRTIEIAGRVPVEATVRITRDNLVIRGMAGPSVGAATLEFSPQLIARLKSGESLIEVADRTLQFLDLNFELNQPTDVTAVDFALLSVGGSGKLDLDGCRITSKGLPRSAGGYVISVANLSAGSVPPNARNPDEVRADWLEPIGVSMKNCVVRGELSLLKIAVSQRIEVELKHVLLGISGVAVDLQAIVGDGRMPPALRIYCQQSTFATAEGFAKIRYREDSLPSLAMNRTSNDCVYWSARGKPHISVVGVQRSEELEDLMHLQGAENAYDSQIEFLCQCRSRDQAESTFRFSTAQAAWFNEFGNEWSVNWKSPVPAVENFSQLEADALDLRNGMFMPGFASASRPTFRPN